MRWGGRPPTVAWATVRTDCSPAKARIAPHVFEWLGQMDRAMGEMRGFMERVAQVVTRQEHDLHHALPRVLGVVEGRLAVEEGATRQMAEAARKFSARLCEEAQRIIELAREAQNLRQELADSVLKWGSNSLRVV